MRVIHCQKIELSKRISIEKVIHYILNITVKTDITKYILFIKFFVSVNEP